MTFCRWKVIAGPTRAPAASACEPHRERIEHALSLGRNAMAIYQELVDAGVAVGYASVRRFVRKLRGALTPEERVVIETAPGEEAQVDYGEGPMVRHPETGKYRRTRLFVLTLGFSRKSVRLLVWKSSTRTWAELHEQAFRRLGGATKIVVLDNLREGVLEPDIHDPTLNPLYRDVLRHYGAVAMPCRVRDPDRKGKVESGVGHTKRTPLKGLRFESLDEAQAYLDHWDERWADTRIHGTTKRQVAAMFADEQPHLSPLPVEPFRYYRFGDRVVHLDGCAEVDGAYYHAPPGWVGRVVQVQWDGLRVRLLCPKTGQLLREHLVERRGGRRVQPGDEPTKTPMKVLALLAELARAGEHVRTLTATFHARRDEAAVRGLYGTRALVKKYGVTVVDDACAALLELGSRRLPVAAPLPRPPCAAAAVARPSRPADSPAHPLPRPHQPTNRRPDMHLIELSRALRQLRLSGIADVLETRLLQAQTEKMIPLDFLSMLVGDELVRRQDRLLERRRKDAAFRDTGKTLDAFDFEFNKKMDRKRVFELATARFVGERADALFLGPPGTGKSHLAQAIGHAVIQQGYRVLYREAHVLLDELADDQLAGERKDYIERVATVPLLIVDDLGMRKLPSTAAEDLLEIIMRRYERASTLISSNRPVEDWGKLLGDTAAVSAKLDRLLHHAHVLKCGPRSWRTKLPADLRD